MTDLKSVTPVALVTGAGRRLGRAIALELAAAGFDVAVHFHSSEDEARDVAGRIRAIGCRSEVFRADLTTPEAPTSLAADVSAHFGRVDVLVNNASRFFPTPLDDVEASVLAAAADEFHALHVRAPLLLVHALAPGMRERGGGAVVNVTDVGVRRPLPGHAPYTASKAALESLTRSLARDLAPHVRVNAVAPGAILPPEGSSADVQSRIRDRVPSGRLGTPEEVAKTVVFLATGPQFVTGQILAVSGGE